MQSLFKPETEAAFTPSFRQYSRLEAQKIREMLEYCEVPPAKTLAELSHSEDLELIQQELRSMINLTVPGVMSALIYEGADVGALDSNLKEAMADLESGVELDPGLEQTLYEYNLAGTKYCPQTAMIMMQLLPTAAGRAIYEAHMRAMPTFGLVNKLKVDLAELPSVESMAITTSFYGANQNEPGDPPRSIFDKFLPIAYIKAASTDDSSALIKDLSEMAQRWVDGLQIPTVFAGDYCRRCLVATALMPFEHHFRQLKVEPDLFYGTRLGTPNNMLRTLLSGPLAVLLSEKSPNIYAAGTHLVWKELKHGLEMVQHLGLPLSMGEMINKQGMSNELTLKWGAFVEPLPIRELETLILRSSNENSASEIFEIFRTHSDELMNLSDEALATLLVPLSDTLLEHELKTKQIKKLMPSLYEAKPGLKAKMTRAFGESNKASSLILSTFHLSGTDLKPFMPRMSNQARREIIEYDFGL